MLVPRPKLGVWKVSKNTVDHEATAREAHGTKEGLGANGSRAKSPRCKEHIELKEGPGLAVVAAVERCIADLQGEVEWLKAMLEAIAEYKDSSNFKLELQRSSQVSYEYGYQVVLAQFQDKYPDLEVEENPFTSLPEDGNVPIEEVPFDDSPAPPEV
ncbi:hypothetical protein BHM03_00002371 [Ensete ventricosum]|nr:hypothetical protein BHM03_00002371 [Ensete ventricosum]